MKKSRRRVRQPEEIAAILERFRKSGLSQAAFSRRDGVGVTTLQYWLRKQRDGRLPAARPAEPSSPPKQLVPVKIVDTPFASTEVVIELELARGGTLRFRGDVAPDIVARYATALGHRC